ncbi:MAG: NADPH-dependent FMN reductase [Pseudomonas sp.]
MLVVTIGGSPSPRSRTGLLLDQAGHWLEQRGIRRVHFDIHQFDPAELLLARFSSPGIRSFIEQVSRADGLIVGTPVYKASFAGALKVLLDVLPERALAYKVVLPIATGGTQSHMLAVDYALKPVLAALKAQETLQGVFATDDLIQYGEPPQFNEQLLSRLHEALEQFAAALARRPAPIDPNLLNDRLIQARCSI